jgi:hypothetical protein
MGVCLWHQDGELLFNVVGGLDNIQGAFQAEMMAAGRLLTSELT